MSEAQKPKAQSKAGQRSKAILLDAATVGISKRRPTDKAPKKQKARQNLLPSQRAFAALLVAGKNQTQAYLESHPGAGGMTRKQIWEHASRLAAHPQVVEIVANAQAEVIAQAQQEYRYGLKEAIEEIDQAKAFALSRDNPAAVMKAIELKTKLHGLHVEDRQNLRRPYGDLTEAALLQMIRDKAQALGVEIPPKV